MTSGVVPLDGFNIAAYRARGEPMRNMGASVGISAGNYDIGPAVDGQLKKPVVGRIAAGHDALDDVHRFGFRYQFLQPCAGSGHDEFGEVGPAQYFEELPFGGRGLEQASLPFDKVHGHRGQGLVFQNGADEDVGVNHDPHRVTVRFRAGRA
jgi:hypothetical protein